MINNKIILEMMMKKRITIKTHLMNKIQVAWNLKVTCLNLELMNNWMSTKMLIIPQKIYHKIKYY